MRILVTSDRPETLERAAEYTRLFAGPDAAIMLMPIYEDEEAAAGDRRQLETVRDDLTETLDRPLETEHRYGQVVDQILAEAERDRYDLVVLGIHLRRGWGHLRPKLVARKVARQIRVPLLIVFPAWQQLRRILVCTGGEKPAERVVRFAGRLAASAGAEVTVLHVMSQIPMASDAQVEDLAYNTTEVMAYQTREGRHLQRTLDILTDLGLPEERCTTRVRYGFVVDEIVQESEESDIDLVVVGAPTVSADRSWNELRELIQEDVAERVLMDARRPVLIV